MTLALTRTAVGAVEFPPCPPWCHTCTGGDTYQVDGHTHTTDRLHEGDIFSTRLSGDGVDQMLWITVERCDTPDGPGPVRTLIRLENADRPTNLTPAQEDAELAGMSRAFRDSTLAHYLAGGWATQTGVLTPDAIAGLAAALTGPVG